jgi:hypothetical protein
MIKAEALRRTREALWLGSVLLALSERKIARGECAGSKWDFSLSM